MFRSSSSTARLLRQSSRAPRISYKHPASKRFLSTEPPHKTSRSWKNSAARWAIAAGGVYWYNTTPLFAEKQQYTIQDQEAPLPTLESLSRSSRFALPSEDDLPVLPVQPTSTSPPSIDPKSPLPQNIDAPTQTPADLESEAAAQGAFNEETGEINWDCPCLGGMAHGPCGEEFRAAFSCFVYSKEEPKGMDCVEKFKGMQTCFREHPEEYGDQLDEDEQEVEQELLARQSLDDGENVDGSATQKVSPASEEKDISNSGSSNKASKVTSPDSSSSKDDSKSTTRKPIYDSSSETKTISNSQSGVESGDNHKTSLTSAGKIKAGIAGDEGGDLVPKAAHDATIPSNTQK